MLAQIVIRNIQIQKIEIFARPNPTSDSGLKRIFFNRIKTILKYIRLIIRQMLLQIEVFCPVFDRQVHLSNYPGRTSRILASFFRFYANCMNIISMVFFIFCGNCVLFSLSCRWLIPKYCSTIYRYFEMVLFRFISNSVNFALTLS